MTSYIYRFQDLLHILLKRASRLSRSIRRRTTAFMVKTKGDAWSPTAGLIRTAGTVTHGVGIGTAGLGIAVHGIKMSGTTVDGNAHPLRGTLTHSATTPGMASGVNTTQSRVNDAAQQQ